MLITIAYLRDYKEYVGTLGLWSFDVWSKYHPPGTTRKKQILKYKGHFNIETLPLTLIALTENDRLIGMCSLTEEEGIHSDSKTLVKFVICSTPFSEARRRQKAYFCHSKNCKENEL